MHFSSVLLYYDPRSNNGRISIVIGLRVTAVFVRVVALFARGRYDPYVRTNGGSFNRGAMGVRKCGRSENKKGHFTGRRARKSNVHDIHICRNTDFRVERCTFVHSHICAQ